METAVGDGGEIGVEGLFRDASVSREVDAVSNVGVTEDVGVRGELGAVSKIGVIGDLGAVVRMSGSGEVLEPMLRRLDIIL